MTTRGVTSCQMSAWGSIHEVRTSHYLWVKWVNQMTEKKRLLSRPVKYCLILLGCLKSHDERFCFSQGVYSYKGQRSINYILPVLFDNLLPFFSKLHTFWLINNPSLSAKIWTIWIEHYMTEHDSFAINERWTFQGDGFVLTVHLPTVHTRTDSLVPW